MSEIGTYNDRLNSDWDFKMTEMGRFERGEGDVRDALEAVTDRLSELAVPYAVLGGMALQAHGYNRFTTDVDVLIDRDSLAMIHEALSGRGYLPVFAGSKNLRDTVRKVPIEFVIAGDYPGDGKPKPVAFPKPQDASVEIEGIRFVTLPKLVELKLASGMTNELRAKDLGDVIELITTLELPPGFGEQLDPFVRGRFVDLAEKVAASRQ